MPSSCEDPQGLCLASPAVQTASLLASAVSSPCWAGFGLSELPCTPSLQERSGHQPDPLPQGCIQALGLLSRDLSHRPSSLGPGHPHLPHAPAPAVQAAGHRMSRKLQCQAGFLLTWHKPRELSSHHCRAAKHQASCITAPKPSSSFRGSTWQAASGSKCLMLHHCLIKTSVRL